MARLPDFMAVGPSRTGTTWLHSVLDGHVELPARVKEIEFFTRHYDRGVQWYAWHFRHCHPDLPVGEVNPCFRHEQARKRIEASGTDNRLEVDGGLKADNIPRVAAARARTPGGFGAPRPHAGGPPTRGTCGRSSSGGSAAIRAARGRRSPSGCRPCRRGAGSRPGCGSRPRTRSPSGGSPRPRRRGTPGCARIDLISEPKTKCSGGPA